MILATFESLSLESPFSGIVESGHPSVWVARRLMGRETLLTADTEDNPEKFAAPQQDILQTFGGNPRKVERPDLEARIGTDCCSFPFPERWHPKKETGTALLAP